MTRRNQRQSLELADVQRMIDSDLKTCLLRIVDGPLQSRSLLENKTPWDEVGRGLMPYTPFAKGLKMIRDASRTARREATKEKQALMRENIEAFMTTLERFMLEPLTESEDLSDVIPLLIEETKVQGQCDQAEDLAKINQSPTNLTEVARKAEAQARISTRLASACWRAANRAGLTLHRGMQAAR
jgi:hypothetical protein